jgi:hypothetical protein
VQTCNVILNYEVFLGINLTVGHTNPEAKKEGMPRIYCLLLVSASSGYTTENSNTSDFSCCFIYVHSYT